MDRSTKPTDANGAMPRRVLVVEDDAILGVVIEDALRIGGVADVEICASTDAALAAMKRDQPDAIVLDVHLADRDDGWAVAELVRTLGADSPRIIFSTGAPGDIPAEIADMGCVLEKPYDPAMLVRLLREPKRKGIISRLRGALRP